MSSKNADEIIPVETSFEAWRKDPGYVEAYDALEEGFALARLFIDARTNAGLSQRQLASRMETSQSYIARLEGGKEKPSTTTLRRFAEATGHRLVIGFEAVGRRGSGVRRIRPVTFNLNRKGNATLESKKA
ncbi:MAG: helix-turn-helix domain-containing protein [Alphaproteobacteria bacterium]|jgi:ribosome-binding protein aMBF1 (putative translation factor)